MLAKLTHNIELGFREIENNATADQTRVLFENLSLLQQSIKNNNSNPKRNHTSQESMYTKSMNEDKILSPRKKVASPRKYFTKIPYTLTPQINVCSHQSYLIWQHSPLEYHLQY